MEVKITMPGMGEFAQRFALSDNGTLTRLSLSETGSFVFGAGEAEVFKNTGIGMFDVTNGNVLYKYEGNGQDFDTQACVDTDSLLVACSEAKFQEGGALHLTTADVPSSTSSFTPMHQRASIVRQQLGRQLLLRDD